MKILVTLSFAAGLVSLAFLGCVNPGSTSNATASITVTNPDLGGAWDAGTVLTIHWVSTGSVGSSVAITLFDTTTLVSTIVSSVPNSGVYAWSIPKELPAGSEYRIKITSTTAAQVYGYSVPFTIANNLDDYEPDNSSSLATLIDTSGTLQTHRISVTDTDWFKFTATQGRAYCIQTYGNAVTTLQLYATNAMTLLSSSSSGGEGYNALIVWTCVTGGVYYFKVTSPSGLAGAKYTVNVRAGSAILDITYPAPDMPFLSSGDTLGIRWVYSANSGNYVSLYAYCADTLAYKITSSTSNAGLYNWIIPSSLTTSSKYQIKIVSNNDTSISDLSDQFSITRVFAALTITTPTATSTWNTGTSYSIYWVYSGNPGNYVSLALYDSSLLVTTITSSAYVSYKSYSWTIPLGLPSSSHYRIKITSISDTSLYGYSAEFSITKVASTLSITTPTATSSWSTGSSYYIYWSYTGNPGSYISLALCDSAATPVATIISSYSLTSGYYYWTIPSTVTTGKYRIKITGYYDTTISSLSSAFTITKVPSSITITTPSAASNWTTGTAYSIYWTYTGSPGSYVSLWLYDSASALVTTIASSAYLSNQTYSWTVPSVLSTGKYRIKIASYSDTTINSFSGAFTITKVPSSIAITTPSSATSWSTGSSYYIYWTYTGNPGSYVSLALYDSTATRVAAISSSSSLSSGYYYWTIPSTVTTGKYRIKIASSSDTTINSMSGAFTITKVPSSITITTPSAASNWTTGTAYSIYWTYTGSPGSYVSLWLYDSTSALVTTIASSAYLSNQTYSWTVPSVLSTGKYRIKIASYSDTTINSFSSAFTITKTPSTLAVTTPSPLNSWSTGSSYYIYWAYSGSPGSYISLGLYDSTSTRVSTIISSYSLSSGSYYWTIPSTVTTGKYRIKIASTTDTSISGFSGIFTITKTPNSIIITTPSSTTSWIMGTSQVIFWAYSGSPCSYVTISLLDSAALAATIISSVLLSTGYYTWSIPTTLSSSTKYRVKMACTTDTSNASLSSYFTITKVHGK